MTWEMPIRVTYVPTSEETYWSVGNDAYPASEEERDLLASTLVRSNIRDACVISSLDEIHRELRQLESDTFSNREPITESEPVEIRPVTLDDVKHFLRGRITDSTQSGKILVICVGSDEKPASFVDLRPLEILCLDMYCESVVSDMLIWNHTLRVLVEE